jgi:DnaJ-class molecular chaperone
MRFKVKRSDLAPGKKYVRGEVDVETCDACKGIGYLTSHGTIQSVGADGDGKVHTYHGESGDRCPKCRGHGFVVTS